MVTQAQPSSPFVESQDPQLEYGNFGPSPSAPAPTKFVIATFNIRYAVGSFLITGSLLRRLGVRLPRRRSALIRRHIDEAAAALSTGNRMPRVDILALQEADKETVRAGNLHVAKELARKLQMNFVHAALNIPRGKEQEPNRWYLDFEEPIATTDTGDTGLAVLSRFPIADAKRVELPWSDCEWRPRLALETTFSVGRKSLHIYNAHIDPHANTEDQLEQHRTILELAEKESGPTLILGDFNTLTSESRLRMRGLIETHGFTTPFPNGLATWRAGLIRLQPDWIFVRDVKVVRWGVARGLSVSDHWPVWAEIYIDN